MIVQMIDLASLKRTLLSIPPKLALLVICGYMIGQILSSFKWWSIVKAGGINISYPAALKAYFLGMFVNCFGFGTVGGDLARGLLISGSKDQAAPAVASVVADRLHGLAVLAIIGTVATFLFGRHTLEAIYLWILLGIGMSIVIAWFVGPPLLLRIMPKNRLLGEKFKQIADLFPSNAPVIIKITLISILFHILQISLHRIMGQAVGVIVPWSYLLVVIPFVNIASSLPISWNGLGVRENAYIFFLAPAIISVEQAAAFGALWLLAVTTTSAAGGIVAIATKEFDLLNRNTAWQSESVPS